MLLYEFYPRILAQDHDVVAIGLQNRILPVPTVLPLFSAVDLDS